jgi:hypothetical protein
MDRDEALYATDTGLLDVTQDVKQYVKSFFGASSPQYKQVSGLKFTRSTDEQEVSNLIHKVGRMI